MRALGIIAGQGDLPQIILDHAKKQNIKCYIVYLHDKPQCHHDDYIVTSIGRVSKAIKYFRKNNVSEIILAGKTSKPSFANLNVDFKGLILMGKIIRQKMKGDNTILSTVINYLENQGFKMLAVDEIVSEIHAENGNNTNLLILKETLTDIEIGRNLLTSLSSFDVGQAMAIQNGRIIAIEALEGTDEMIIRSKPFIEKDNHVPAILVKIKKLNQDRRADLPTIGTKTIENLHKNGFGGIAVDTNNTLILNVKETVELAEKHKIFIYGI